MTALGMAGDSGQWEGQKVRKHTLSRQSTAFYSVTVALNVLPAFSAGCVCRLRIARSWFPSARTVVPYTKCPVLSRPRCFFFFMFSKMKKPLMKQNAEGSRN
jgi:hypothetical protein